MGDRMGFGIYIHSCEGGYIGDCIGFRVLTPERALYM